MKFVSSTARAVLAFAFVGVAASSMLVPRQQSCPEASRFGNLAVTSPTNATSYNPGDPINIQVDFSCAIHAFGIVPEFIDYTIQVNTDENNGHEPPIVLARRTLAPGATTDGFSTTIPFAFYFAGAPYNVVLTDTYPTQGTDGSEVLLQGGVEAPITINVASS